MNNIKIRSFPLKLSREQAEIEARRKGGLLGKILLRGRELHDLRLHAVEYYLLTFDIIHRPNWIARTFWGEKELKRQQCRIIANGSTGGCSWAEELPEGESLLWFSEGSIQRSLFSVNDLVSRGKKVAWRVLRRRIGGFPELVLNESYSIFRLFYVAFYDEPSDGKKIRYLPIAADGCSTHRAF